MLTVRKAAELAGVSMSLIYQLCREGALEHSRVGCPGKRGRVLIDPESLRSYLDGCRQRPLAPVPLRHIRQ